MTIDELMLYCMCCDSLLTWKKNTHQAIKCECGESGGSYHEDEGPFTAGGAEPELLTFYLWGSCAPVRFAPFWEQAWKAIEAETPIIGSEFRLTCWMLTKKSKNVIITRYDDEKEFDEDDERVRTNDDDDDADDDDR